MKSYELLLSPFVAWLLSQVMKTAIVCIYHKRIDLSRVGGDGGMPSSHSSIVAALATACACRYGFDSSQFAISLTLALIVMHDASGVRLESGKQAKVINEIREYLQSLSFKSSHDRLEELLGHTPLQVFVGAVLGIAAAIILHVILA